MAASGSDTSKGDASAPLVSPERKVEILGLLLMVLALLLSLAFLSYESADNSIVRSVSFSETLVDLGNAQSEYPVENILGLVGAELARILVPGFLGFGILGLSGLLMVWGYVIFRHRSLRSVLYPSILTVLSVFAFASLMGWFSHALDAALGAWAGSVGVGVAGWMQNVFGLVGSFILLVFTASVLAVLALDHDLQRSVDRLIEGVHQVADAFERGWSYVGTRWNELREADDAEDTTRDPDDGDDTQEAVAKTSAPEEQDGERTEPSPPTPLPSKLSDDISPKRPVRRNDLFGPGPESSSKRETGSPDRPDHTGRGPNDPSSREDKRSDERSASPQPSSRSDAPDDAPSQPDRDSAPPPDTGSRRSPDEDDVAMTIQEQVEEEKADEIDRPAETPEDFQYEPPPLDLLDEATAEDPTINREELEQNKRALLDKLDMYNIDIEEINAVVGPTVTRYELTPAPGIKISRIKSLEDDLAMALAANGIRMIAPIPGKSAVGVEIPNRNRELVRLRDVIGTTKFRDADMDLPIPVGKSIEGEVYLDDLTEMPHLLIAGATGSGKSVGLNAFITGLIYACHPANLRFVIIDPKKIELQQYTPLETQFVAVPEDIDQTVITDIDEASGVLKSVEKEMETRYELLSDAGVRNIKGYNQKFKEGALDPKEGHRHMPFLVVVVDELADLMMTAGDEVEGPISRLAQMARAVGIHLVLATQRPSVDVITGVIKANFSSRIAYEVASRVDSRTILDQGGAEGLVGNGDLLFLSGSDLKRLQGPFVTVEEVERVVKYVADQPGVTAYKLPSLQDAGHGPDETLGVEDTDENFEEAARIIVRRQQGSVSLLQRKLAVGYTRAARIVDQLEEAGVVGPFNGTKAREVLVDDEQELDQLLSDKETEEVDSGDA